VELYSHHRAVRTILHGLEKRQHRLTAVHLVRSEPQVLIHLWTSLPSRPCQVDAHHCADPAKFISVLLVTLSTMVQLEVLHAARGRQAPL